MNAGLAAFLAKKKAGAGVKAAPAIKTAMKGKKCPTCGAIM